LKNALLIVTLSTLITGCADYARRAEAPAAVSAPLAAATPDIMTQATLTEVAAAPAAPADPEAIEVPLPSVALSKELMFKLLSAEIAFQRGQWQSAYVTLTGAAQQTRDPRLARRATEIAITAKRNDEALAAIRLWRELAPKDEDATQFLLGFVVLSDDIDSALPLFAERLANASPPSRGFLMLQIQRMLSRARDKTAAFVLLEKLVAPYASSAEAHIALAQAAFINSDGARAVDEARMGLALNTGSELAALTLAQVLPDKREAALTLTDFLAAHPASRVIRIAHARLKIEQKQFTKAREEFETMLKLQPDDLSSLFALGVLTSQMDDLVAAEKYLRRYIDVLDAASDEEQDATQALLLLAQIAEDRKDPAAAIEWLGRVESGPAYFSAQLRRAQLLAQQGSLDNGMTLLRELQPDSPREQVQQQITLAQLLRDAHRLPEAMRVLQEAFVRFPTDPDLLYDYAMLAEKSEQLELMESLLRKLIVLVPDNQHAYNALGYSLAERNTRLPEALTLIEKALTIAPNDPFILDSLGWVQYRMGKLNEAEAALRRAHDLRPDPEIAVHLGEVLWVKGLKDDAQKLWRDANAKDPQNGTLKNTLARLQVQL
jgi:Flp pilus assembly protein TadD